MNRFIKKIIRKKGNRFQALAVPKDIRKGKLRDCFDHCLIEALRSNGKYRYCEGLVYVKGQWIHHAWLTDATGLYAFDPIWKVVDDQTGAELPFFFGDYVGVILDLALVVEFVQKTQYKSPLANHDKDSELAQKIYDTAT